MGIALIQELYIKLRPLLSCDRCFIAHNLILATSPKKYEHNIPLHFGAIWRQR